MDVTGSQGVPYGKETLNSRSYILILIFFISGQYLKNGFLDSIQICHVIITGFQGVPYFKMTLNSYVSKRYVEFTFFLFFHEYTENKFRDFIPILLVYVTGHR